MIKPAENFRRNKWDSLHYAYGGLLLIIIGCVYYFTTTLAGNIAAWQVEDSTHEFLFPTPFSEGALSFFSMLANYLWILGVVFLITAGMRFLIVYIYCKKHNSNQDKFLIKTSKIFKRIIASAIILIGLAFLVYIGFKIHFYRATPENPPGPILVLGEVLMNYALGIPLMLAVTFLIYWISVENAWDSKINLVKKQLRIEKHKYKIAKKGIK